LKASEPKSDLGLDAYAPGELFENGMGRGTACSNTATLTKIRKDIEEAQKHFNDLKILFFATPKPVSEKNARSWREKVKKHTIVERLLLKSTHGGVREFQTRL
jgi:hypothetical protein